MSEVKMKKVDGDFYPASDFAYVPNPQEPSTWKLPIFDMRHVGDALAALNSDFRGKTVQIPQNDRHSVEQKILERKALLMSQNS